MAWVIAHALAKRAQSIAKVKPATYIMYRQGEIYKILNGLTGIVEFSGPDAIGIINDLLASIPADESGITLHLKKGRFTGAGTITVPTEFSLTIQGEAHVQEYTWRWLRGWEQC